MSNIKESNIQFNLGTRVMLGNIVKFLKGLDNFTRENLNDLLNDIDKEDFNKMNHTYQPLPENLIIGQSNLHGLGLFTNKSIDEGVNLGVSHMEQDLGSEISYMTLLRTPLGGFINHSITRENCYLKNNESSGRYYLITSKEINSGEELFLNYNNCPCDAPDV